MDLLYNMVGSDPRRFILCRLCMYSMDSMDAMDSIDSMYSIDSVYSRDSVDSVCVYLDSAVILLLEKNFGPNVIYYVSTLTNKPSECILSA